MHEHYRLLVSLAADGEATEDELAELAEHMAECDECAALLEAYRAVGDGLGEVEPPEKLAEGTMYRIKYVKKKPRFAFGRFTAVAAAAVVIVVAGFAFFSGGKGDLTPQEPAAMMPEAPDGEKDVSRYDAAVPAAPDVSEADIAGNPYLSFGYTANGVAPAAIPGPQLGMVTDSARHDELRALGEGRSDVAAVCVKSGEAPDDPAVTLNSMSGGVWYETSAEILEMEEFDEVIYLNSGAEKCIIAVYYD